MIHRRHTLRATHDFTQTPPHSWGGPPTQLFYERRRHIIKTLLHILIHCIILFVLKVSAKCLQTTTTTTTNQSAANSIERLGCGRHDSSFFSSRTFCVCVYLFTLFSSYLDGSSKRDFTHDLCTTLWCTRFGTIGRSKSCPNGTKHEITLSRLIKYTTEPRKNSIKSAASESQICVWWCCSTFLSVSRSRWRCCCRCVIAFNAYVCVSVTTIFVWGRFGR